MLKGHQMLQMSSAPPLGYRDSPIVGCEMRQLLEIDVDGGQLVSTGHQSFPSITEE
jgi:hypothetical protein